MGYQGLSYGKGLHRFTRVLRGGLTEQLISGQSLEGDEQGVTWLSGQEHRGRGQKDRQAHRQDANAHLDSEGTRQKPQPPVGPTHLDRKLSGQNGPDGVTQAGQEAAGST